MPWDLRAVDTDFTEDAPFTYRTTRPLAHPPERVFHALAGDPAGWGHWYPGFSPRGRYLTPAPQSEGSRRQMWMAGVRYDETILAWEEPKGAEPGRWAFRVDTTSFPIAYALVEDYRVRATGAATSEVDWIFAIDPRPPLRRALRLMEPALSRLFGRAMSNLDRSLAR